MKVSRLLGARQVSYRVTNQERYIIEDLVTEITEMQREDRLGEVNTKQILTMLGIDIEKSSLRRRPRTKAEKKWFDSQERKLDKLFPKLTTMNYTDKDVETHVLMCEKVKEFLICLFFNNVSTKVLEHINEKYKDGGDEG